MADPVLNFAKASVSTTYNASATSIVLSSGEGAKFPAPATDGAFNLVWWNSADYADPADDPNVEIVRCTARSTDTLTVTRAQEGTSGSLKSVGASYKMILAFTKKSYDDVKIGTKEFYYRVEISDAEAFTNETENGFVGAITPSYSSDVVTITSANSEFLENFDVMAANKDSCPAEYVSTSTIKFYLPPTWKTAWDSIVFKISKDY